MIVGIDFGITNTDIAISNNGNLKFFSIPSKKCSLETECLFGETVEIKEKYKNWSRNRSLF